MSDDAVAEIDARPSGRGDRTASPPNGSSGRVAVRIARRSDLPAFVEIARLHHELSLFSHLAFSPDKVLHRMGRIEPNGRSELLLAATQGERTIGGLYATLGPYLVCERDAIVSVHTITVHPELPRFAAGKAFIRLLQGCTKWAEARGVADVLVHNTAGYNTRATDRVLRRWGGAVIGGSYIRST